jgi:hypothetical protein
MAAIVAAIARSRSSLERAFIWVILALRLYAVRVTKQSRFRSEVVLFREAICRTYVHYVGGLPIHQGQHFATGWMQHYSDRVVV